MAIVRDATTGVKTVPPVGRIPGQPTWFQRQSTWLLGAIAVVGLLLGWQIAVGGFGITSELILPSPLVIAGSIGGLLTSPDFWYDMSVSGTEFIWGFGLAVVVGLLLGLLMGWFPTIEKLLDPIVNFFNNLPRIALAPLFVIWFGIGIESKIAIVFFGAIFPIVITTIAGVKNLDPLLIRAARAFEASNAQLFRTVALPGSVPYILSGLRLAIAHAVTGVVVGEFIAARAGVGLLMIRAAQTYDTPVLFAAIIIVAAVGMILTEAIAFLERRFQGWRPIRK